MNKCAVRSLNLQRVLDPWVWRSSTRGDCRAAHTPTPCCRSGPAHRSAWWRSCCWSFDSLPSWPPLHWTTATTTARYQDISKDNLLMFYHRANTSRIRSITLHVNLQDTKQWYLISWKTITALQSVWVQQEVHVRHPLIRTTFATRAPPCAIAIMQSEESEDAVAYS